MFGVGAGGGVITSSRVFNFLLNEILKFTERWVEDVYQDDSDVTVTLRIYLKQVKLEKRTRKESVQWIGDFFFFFGFFKKLCQPGGGKRNVIY